VVSIFLGSGAFPGDGQPSDNEKYVMYAYILPPVPVVGPVAVPFIAEETTPFTGEVNIHTTHEFGDRPIANV
jgi:hypothetical protein